MSPLPLFSHEVLGCPGKPWVIFVPGIGNDRTFWADQAALLSESKRVVLFDPWGHGESPEPPAECTFATFVEGLIGLMDHVSIAKATLVGLGFGGSIALAAAARFPTRVDSVVACCCRSRQPDDRRAFWRERHAQAGLLGMSAISDITVDRWLSDTFRKAHPAIDCTLRSAMKRTTLRGYQASVAAFAEMDFTAELNAITCPVQLIAAEEDHGGGPVAAMRAMEDAISFATLRVIPAVGHICVAEAPDTVHRIIAEHLAKPGRNAETTEWAG